MKRFFIKQKEVDNKAALLGQETMKQCSSSFCQAVVLPNLQKEEIQTVELYQLEASPEFGLVSLTLSNFHAVSVTRTDSYRHLGRTFLKWVEIICLNCCFVYSPFDCFTAHVSCCDVVIFPSLCNYFDDYGVIIMDKNNRQNYENKTHYTITTIIL